VRQKSNHWFLAMFVEGIPPFVKIYPFVESKAIRDKDLIILCGEGCALKFMQQSLVKLHKEKDNG
jgi:hypothetical protein